jgi:hypothetical protein
VVDRAYHAVLWIDVVGCLLSVGRIGVGGRDKGECIAIEVTVGVRVVQKTMSRGVVLGVRVVGCVVVIVHGTKTKVVAVREMLLRKLLLNDWDECGYTRIELADSCAWHLIVGEVSGGRSWKRGEAMTYRAIGLIPTPS